MNRVRICVLRIGLSRRWIWFWAGLGLWSGARRGDNDDAVANRDSGASAARLKGLSLCGAHQSKKGIASEQSRGEADDAKGHAGVAKTASLFGEAEQSRNPGCKWSTICSHGERRRTAPFFHEGESASVFGGIAADGERYVIATIFAFGANALAEPPDGRVVEEQSFGGNLKKVEESIEAADVRQFVSYDGAKLQLGKPGECSEREKNHGTEPANDRRRVKVQRFAIANCAGNAEAVLHFAAQGNQCRVHWLGIAATQTRHQKESAGGAKTKEEHTDEPEFHENGGEPAGKM